MIKLVLVEDHPIVREGVRTLVEQIPDCKVVAEYSNGQELIDNLKSDLAAIILIDIDMPVMDGITATRRALQENPALRFIALSMYSEMHYYYEMLNAGARGFVCKQSSIEELESAIRAVAKGGSFFSPDLLQKVLAKLNKLPKGTSANTSISATDFSSREFNILSLICQGLNNNELAEKSALSIKTIESYKTRLLRKTGTRNTAQLIIWAFRNKVVC